MRPCRKDSGGKCAIKSRRTFPHSGLPVPQKESIYAIQDKYQAQIAPLAAQIKALMAERDKEIEAVLTPEQLTKVAALKKEAASKAAAGKKPAAKKTEAAAEKPVKSAGGN